MNKKQKLKNKSIKGLNFELSKVKCPICGNPINWIKVVEHTSWAGRVVLLASCWSGNLADIKPEHLFLIELEDLPFAKMQRWRRMRLENEKN